MESGMADDQRFERVEKTLDKLGDKIDELTKVVTTMARIEERMVSLFKRMDRYDTAQAGLDDRLTEVEKVSTKRGAIYHIIEKGFWLAVGGAIAYFSKGGGSQ
jgi:hypothetical protein